MTTPTKNGFWQRLWAREASGVEQDAADMGTAIGLDFVLDEPPLVGVGASAMSNELGGWGAPRPFSGA
ncbi:hypothetical protein [Ideonella margarita]|uniref:Uncharacterized protein n=1 Tax=Ideonella margarita TaxID=2984191 RepID=A0ABU9C8X5_9BURK